MNRLENSVFKAIRQGLLMMMPLLIVSSVALMLISLPIPAYQIFLSGLCNGKVVEMLDFAYSGVMDFFAVILAASTSFNYAMLKRRVHKEYAGYDCIIVLPLITLVILAGYSGIQFADFSVKELSNTNTFTAIFVALVSGKLFFVIRNHMYQKKKKRAVSSESVYTEALDGILPAVVVILFFALLSQGFKMIFEVGSIQEVLENFANSCIQRIDNNFLSGVFILFVIHLMWFFGIHGSNVLDALLRQNFSAIENGIYSKTFQDVFVILGGCGSVLCLIIAIVLFSKRKNTKNLAKIAFPATLFNISEIIVFGLPLIFNPVYLLPFITVPLTNYMISYGAVYFGLVPKVVREVEWTTPIFLSGYQATGSWAGAILQLVCLILGVCIYLPFFRKAEKNTEIQLAKDIHKLIEEFQQEEEHLNVGILTERDDEIGKISRYLAADLEEAIQNKETFLLYQPQVNTDEKCIGAETLARWNHPLAGFIYPPLFVQLAREKNILHDLEESILDEAIEAAAKIQNSVSDDFKISINITNHTLEWEAFEDCLERCVTRHQIPCEKIWLEITEQEALVSSNEIIEKLHRLKRKGYKFLIDDFGMGHTSLLYLQTNYFDVVKMDGSLTRDILTNERNKGIIESIVHLGKSLNFTTIAEYVETTAQKEQLKSLGCDVFQGFLYSEPIPLEDFIRWMQKQNKKIA
ncbi:MAG: PTS sugar transporter subunit IIC/EAL domain-containing protein [Lachnospiraceae bacterium]|nr:PTS sugar transporter subunit IIC/EAL domain-containing protein [Lachnospiraceae bacterium]